jgi:hypothetical protein
VFRPLRDEALFCQVTVDEFGAVCWPNGPDLAPDAMHSEITGAPRPRRSESEGHQIRTQAETHRPSAARARKRIAAGERQRSIAHSYNVNQATISRRTE